MIKDIRPQWKNLSQWWWKQQGDAASRTIFDMIEKEYQAFRTEHSRPEVILVDFPSEKSYSLFLLKWS